MATFDAARMDSAHRKRFELVSSVFLHGSPWEREAIDELIDDRDNLVLALRTPSARGPQAHKSSFGAKAVKSIRHSNESGELLTQAPATTFRALAARANFLSQDCPDLAFSCKELCRHFSCPTSASLDNLRRLIR